MEFIHVWELSAKVRLNNELRPLLNQTYHVQSTDELAHPSKVKGMTVGRLEQAQIAILLNSTTSYLRFKSSCTNFCFSYLCSFNSVFNGHIK